MDSLLPPLSLYIHIPWCERKCPYCDFNSHENKQEFSEEEYIQCLLKDFKQDLPLAQNRKLESVFIGGGTPSLFKIESIDYLLKKIATEIEFSPEVEITLEANPASSQNDYFSALSQTPVNRVSLGVQSFQNEKLGRLGRLHSSAQAQQALVDLRKHFTNFNIDLMFGLTQQSVDDALFDLNTALSFFPKHLSWYQLTIEPNTVFYRNKPVLPDEDIIFEIQEAGRSMLEKNVFKHYEVSAFCQTKWQSKHNLNYWQFGDYLAIGAGAHGKITQITNGHLEIMRFQKKRMPKDYVSAQNSSFTSNKFQVKKADLPLEFFMNYLRLNESAPLSVFYQRTGLAYSSIYEFSEQAQKLNLIKIENNEIIKTKLGAQHLDTLLTLF